MKEKYPRFAPGLAIIQAGERPDSITYVRMKSRAAEEVGINYTHIGLPAEASVDEIVNVVKKLNDDHTVSGILVQLPLGSHIDPEGERTVTEAVSPQKDVDGCVIFSRVSPICTENYIDSTRIILDICPLARPIHCLHLARPPVSSALSNLQVCRSKELGR